MTEAPLSGIARARSAVQTQLPPAPPTIFAEFSLEGHVGIVAGGAGALGLESALALVEAGATVYVLDIFKEDGLRDDFRIVQEYVSELGRPFHYISGSATDKAFVEKVCQDISEKEGRFDFCVAANGFLHSEVSCLDISAELFDKVFAANATASLYLAQAAGKEMVRWQRGGAILFYASIAGDSVQRKSPNEFHAWSAYATAKGAVHQITRSFAVELAKQGIRVNSLSPGQLSTPMTDQYIGRDKTLLKHWTENNNPMGRLGRTDEVRGATVFLCSRASSYITGTDLRIDGGMRIW